MLRVLAAFVAAVLVTYGLEAIAQTQHVMSRLVDMGMPVTFSDRLAATLDDLVGMAPLYMPMLAVGLAIAFGIAAGVMRLAPRWRPVGYPLAGGLAVLVLHVSLTLALGITPIAVARTTLGLTSQALAGAVGGWAFAMLRRPRTG
jgi:predicted signal transduction protein with EAL and GGDEF domain